MASAGPGPEHSPNLDAARLALLLGSLLLGVAVAAALMPALFRRIPTDISRIGVLLDALRTGQPQVVVLGNSVIMSAVDARQLSGGLPGHPLAYNLSSTGQSLVESALLQQELPSSVEAMVQTVVINVDEGRALAPQKYNTFYLYGFRPKPATRAMLDGIYGAPVTALLDASDLSQRFQGRWAMRQFVDTQLRSLLREDLTLAEAERDLYHPQRYSKALPEAKLARLLNGRIEKLRATPPEVTEDTLRLLEAMARQSTEAGRVLVILLPPIHPALRSALGPLLSEPAARLERRLAGRAGVHVFDASGVLDAEHFIDDRHPNDAGAAILTRRLADWLGARL